MSEKSVKESTQSYVPSDSDDDVLESSEDTILIGKSGLINANGTGEQHRSHSKTCLQEPILVPHDEDCTTRYRNSSYWVN